MRNILKSNIIFLERNCFYPLHILLGCFTKTCLLCPKVNLFIILTFLKVYQQHKFDKEKETRICN